MSCLKHKNNLSTFCRLAISEVLLVATAWLPARDEPRLARANGVIVTELLPRLRISSEHI